MNVYCNRNLIPLIIESFIFSIIGSERFSSYSGFADTFKFSGNFEDTEERDNLMRKKTIIVAIDALPFNSSNSLIQYSPDSLVKKIERI